MAEEIENRLVHADHANRREVIPPVAALRLAADDMAKIWINDKVIGAATRTTPATLNQQAHRVKLKRGRNRIMAKVVQRRGYWELGMSVAAVDPSKMAVRGLSLGEDLSFVDAEAAASGK